MNSRCFRPSRSQITCLLTLLALATLTAPADASENAQAANPYKEVSEQDVTKLQFVHYFDEQKQYQPAEFAWTFAEDGTFELRAGKRPIAVELRRRLTGDEAEVRQITGRWQLDVNRCGGKLLTFTDIKADDAAVSTEFAGYSIYRTAPTVIRLDTPQYVFAIQN